MGQTLLQTIDAVDSGPTVPSPSPYVLLSGQVVPMWAVKLLVLAWILPVLLTTIDGVARARRRGYGVARWVLWVLAGAVPFALATLLIVALRGAGLIKVIPDGLVGAGVVPLAGAGIAILAGAGAVLLLSLALLRPAIVRLAVGRPRARKAPSEGAGAGLLLVLCCAALVVWVRNPFAALLLIPALHLWMWCADPDLALRPAPIAALVLIGLAPAALIVLYYATTLDLGFAGVIWTAVLLLAGGSIGLGTALLWCVLLGCVVSVCAIALGRARVEHEPEQQPITVRGPINYAGPGSLGGTESALRR